MSALKRLSDLQVQLESLERNSIDQDSSISSEQIKSIRLGINALTNELAEELKYSHRYHESYRTQHKKSVTIPEDEETEQDLKEKISKPGNPHDDETFAWLDDNYGGNIYHSTLISPKRSPLERFKIMGNMLKSEIKECRKYGLDTKNIRGAGWARMSIAVNSSLTITNMALAIPKVNKILSQCWDLSTFDIFELSKLSEIRGHILLVFGSYLAQQFKWLRQYHIPSDKFHNFLLSIEQNYNNIPYHNKIHAADVTHTMMVFCKTDIFNKHMSQLDKLSAFIAAICHDVGHTGQTNNYHINSSSILAIRYNDRSVLENFHLATMFQILRDERNNFLENLTKQEFKYVRDTIIKMVLGTDLFFHQKQLKKLQQFGNIITRQNKLDFKIFTTPKNKATLPRIRGVLNEKRFIMECALHLSDISNPTKKTSVSIEWTKRITQEFFEQGDMEKSLNLPISPGCDRNMNANIAKQSLAFIDFIVLPMFNAYNIIDKQTDKFIKGIKKSRDHWQSQM